MPQRSQRVLSVTTKRVRRVHNDFVELITYVVLRPLYEVAANRVRIPFSNQDISEERCDFYAGNIFQIGVDIGQKIPTSGLRLQQLLTRLQFSGSGNVLSNQAWGRVELV